jgi:hypothetical protein
MDFQSPGGIGTGLEGPEGVELQEQEAQGARPQRSKHPGEEITIRITIAAGVRITM